MKLNADLSQKAVVDSKNLKWESSPASGVDRKLLERDGDEVAFATSLVKYEPSSSFPSHVHGGGEEFLVVEGVFSDEHGDYQAGTYIRNPINSSHAPFTRPGCIILVKLRQMSDLEEPRVCIDSAKWNPNWKEEASGNCVLDLFWNEKTGEDVKMVELVPGKTLSLEIKEGGAEVFVFEGEINIEENEGKKSYSEGHWIRFPEHQVTTIKLNTLSTTSCSTCFIKNYHKKRDLPFRPK